MNAHRSVTLGGLDWPWHTASVRSDHLECQISGPSFFHVDLRGSYSLYNSDQGHFSNVSILNGVNFQRCTGLWHFHLTAYTIWMGFYEYFNHGTGSFYISYSNRHTSWNTWNRHLGSFIVNLVILLINMKLSSDAAEARTVTVTSKPNRLPHFYVLDTELDLYWMTRVYHKAFLTGVACQQGTLIFLDTWFIPLFGTCIYTYCWDHISQICQDFFRLFSIRISPVTFLIIFAYVMPPFQLLIL